MDDRETLMARLDALYAAHVELSAEYERQRYQWRTEGSPADGPQFERMTAARWAMILNEFEQTDLGRMIAAH